MDAARMEGSVTDDDAVMAAEHQFEVYAYFDLHDHEPSVYFRVSGCGVFQRWNATTRHWVKVHGKGRDFISRAIENGDGAVRATDEQVAGLKERRRRKFR